MPAGASNLGPAGPVFQSTVLPCGLTVLTERLPWLRSVTLGLAFRIGGRDDPAELAGCAHLVEHMVFKGTAELDARMIAVEAENRGAELNAFTDKEMTVFHGRFPGELQVEVTDLLARIVAAPAFDPAELAKEQGVVIEEIRSAEDDPGSKAFNLLTETCWPDTPMGWSIAGTPETVARADSASLRRLYASRYGCATGVAVATGAVDHEALCRVLEDRLGSGRTARLPARPAEPLAGPAIRVKERPELSQVYACLALPAFPYPDPRRHALSVLNTALGGGVSSRLFQRLREQEGLVYSVSSFTELFEDSGLLGVFFVAERARLERCLTVLGEELDRVRRDRFDAEEFERARTMSRSSVMIGLESPVGRMLRMARTHHLLGRVVPVEETLDAYARLELGDVNRLAGELLTDGFRIGAVGPVAAEDFRSLAG